MYFFGLLVPVFRPCLCRNMTKYLRLKFHLLLKNVVWNFTTQFDIFLDKAVQTIPLLSCFKQICPSNLSDNLGKNYNTTRNTKPLRFKKNCDYQKYVKNCILRVLLLIWIIDECDQSLKWLLVAFLSNFFSCFSFFDKPLLKSLLFTFPSSIF